MPPVFRLVELRKTYGEGEAAVQALRGVDLQIAEGELVVLLGPSGSGKSTLLNILGGLDRPTGGQCFFRELDLAAAPDAQVTQYRRLHVGFVFQFYNLIASLTAAENVELVTEVATDPMPAQEALELVGLAKRLQHFPAQLSGGEQQRVAIARAIAKRPTVLLCDEPTGALDVATGIHVLEAIVKANEKLHTTTLLITHNADIARIGDRAVFRAARLPPAAALAPPAPVSFGRLGRGIEAAARKLDGKTRMVARRIARFPRRSATTIVGIALALALLITSQHFPLSMNHIVDVTFGVAQRMDATLTFAETADDRILADVSRLPGVFAVEPLRATEVILTAGSRQRRDTVMGLTEGGYLYRLLDQDMAAVAVRPDGITLSNNLAQKLGVQVGDTVDVQATDGHRANAQLTVVAVVKPYLAGAAYMEMQALGRALREPGRVSAAYVLMDRSERDALNREVKQLPMIAGVSFLDNASTSMRNMLNQGSGFFAYMFVVFSSLMAGGVAYSASRVTFAEQERDLATLRVLGFSRREVSYVLLAEIGALLLVALPVGVILGALLSRWLMAQFQTELFTFPYVTESGAYGRSALFVAAAVVGAALAVRRSVDRLDLVGVLKSRE